MTVQELYDELGKEIQAGHGDLRVIANCDFVIRRKGTEYENNVECKPEHYERYLPFLNDVYYQSGEIELGFSDF